MTITLELPGDLEQAIRSRAAESGHDLSSTVISLLRHSLGGGNGSVSLAGPLPLAPSPHPDDEPLSLQSNETGYESAARVQSRLPQQVLADRERILGLTPEPRPIPQGKTLFDVVEGAWPGDETEEQIRESLEKLS